MNKEMKEIVLSAFGKFGSYLVNPVEVVAKKLHGKTIAGFKVNSIFFEATIPEENRGKKLLAFAQNVNASGIISLGLASDKKGLCVERVAVNRVFNLKYCPAALNNTPVDNHRPYEEKLELDPRPWNVGAFQNSCRSESIPVMEISTDANGFCCNHLMYQVRSAQLVSQDWIRIPFIFVHAPCSLEAISDPEMFAKAGKTTITIDKIIRGLALLLGHSLT